jgi:hypothetical protein
MRSFLALSLLLVLDVVAIAQAPPTRPIPPPGPVTSKPRTAAPGSLAYLLENPEARVGPYQLRGVVIVSAEWKEVDGVMVLVLTLADPKKRDDEEVGEILFVAADPDVSDAILAFESLWKNTADLEITVGRMTKGPGVAAYLRGATWRNRYGEYLASTALIPSDRVIDDGATSGSAPGKDVHVRGYYRKDGTYVRPHTRSAPGRKRP